MANGTGVINLVSVTSISGNYTDLNNVLNTAVTTNSQTLTTGLTISDTVTVAQLTALNDFTSGTIDYTNSTGISGTSTEIINALAGTISNYSGTVEITPVTLSATGTVLL